MHEYFDARTLARSTQSGCEMDPPTLADVVGKTQVPEVTINGRCFTNGSYKK